VPREVSHPERATRAIWQGARQGLFFWGVLLLGCSARSSGVARTRAAAPAAQQARRLGRHVPSRTGSEQLSYSVRIDPQLTRLDVEVCPHGFGIERLNAPSPGAQRWLLASGIVTPEGASACPEEGVDLPLLRADECVRYAVDLSAKSNDPTSLERVGDDVLASPDAWLWVPTPRPVGLHVQVHFELPDGVLAAMPWQKAVPSAAPDGAPAALSQTEEKLTAGTDFVVPETTFAWKAAGAFSHAPPAGLAVDGATLRVVEVGSGFGAQRSAVRHWIAQGARVSNLLFGRLPVAQPLVLVVPGDRLGPAFGVAVRGGGPAIELFLNRQLRVDSLAEDWTCVHEFLHLGVPHLPPQDAWLFEGLTTYYTEVTRARAGLVSAKVAYQHLLDGFQRGRRSGGALTLRDESASMRERHSFYRVYWAGAALAFLTDVAARRAGGPSLDAALRSLAECCAGSAEEWSAQRVLENLDHSMGAPWLTDLAQRWLGRKEFPALDVDLSALGVTGGPHGEAIFARAPDSALRDAIMAGAALPTKPYGEPQQTN
jgi:hypothetical protein